VLVKYVVGLGNPGKQYARTRHNLGWMVLDLLAERLGIRDWRRRWSGLVAAAGEWTLLLPTTYMNESGRSVAALIADTGTGLDDVLIVLDDLNLPLGSLRMRRGGSSGGHHGLESIASWLGTEGFPRLRVGIGPCPPHAEPREFVLSPFAPAEDALMAKTVQRAADSLLCWHLEGAQAAMDRYNGPVEAPREGP